jgi:hypothetical protein
LNSPDSRQQVGEPLLELHFHCIVIRHNHTRLRRLTGIPQNERARRAPETLARSRPVQPPTSAGFSSQRGKVPIDADPFRRPASIPASHEAIHWHDRCLA